MFKKLKQLKTSKSKTLAKNVEVLQVTLLRRNQCNAVSYKNSEP